MRLEEENQQMNTNFDESINHQEINTIDLKNEVAEEKVADTNETQPISTENENPETGPTVATDNPNEIQAETKVDDAPATTEGSNNVPPNEAEESTASKEQTQPISETISLHLGILDFAGKPIAGLKYRISIAGNNYDGETDATGSATEINNLLPLQPLELKIKKQNGEYVTKYQGYTSCNDMHICAVSPHIKIELETEPHQGALGSAPPKPKPPLKIDAPLAPGVGQIKKDGTRPSLTPVNVRNEQGHPVATLKDKSMDWAKRHHLPTFGLWSWDDFNRKTQKATTPTIQSGVPIVQKPNPHLAVKPLSNTNSQSINPNPEKTTTNLPAGVSKEQLAKVNELIAIMEEQVTWDWKAMYASGHGAAQIMTEIVNGDFKGTSANVHERPATGKHKLSEVYTPPDGKSEKSSHGRCYASVKIGLWRAQMVISPDFSEEHGRDAQTAGPWLSREGFTEVLSTIPDPRWALPGDVIVYKYPDAIENANKERHAKALANYALIKAAYDQALANYPDQLAEYQKSHGLWLAAKTLHQQEKLEAARSHKKYHAPQEMKEPKPPSKPKAPSLPDVGNQGHIEVRTYDGYMSDFKATSLANANKFVPIAVYRKFYDPLPDLRVRAFLKVLREWECHEEPDDAKRYFLTMNKINGSRVFSDTSTHPFEGLDYKGDTPAGAYQINLGTYKRLSDPSYGIGPGFSPSMQDRFAVAYLEIVGGNALGLIRKGNVVDAVNTLGNIWASLPSGPVRQRRHELRGKVDYVYTMDDLLIKYDTFLHNLYKGSE